MSCYKEEIMSHKYQTHDAFGNRMNHAKPSLMVTGTTIHAERLSLHKSKRQPLEQQALDMIRHAQRIEASIVKAKTDRQREQREKLLLVHKSRLHALLDQMDKQGRGFDVIHPEKRTLPTTLTPRSIAKRRTYKRWSNK